MHRLICVATLAVTLVACGAARTPDPKSADARPGTPFNYAPSNGEIPVENVQGALSSGDYDQGLAALGNGDIDGAEGAYKRIHDRDPKDGAGLVLLGLIREKQGNKEVAEKAYRRAIELRPDLEDAYVNLSALLVNRRRADEALAVARDGLTKFPSSSALHANAATALAAQGDQAAAASEFDQATRAAPNDPALLVTYGHWLRIWKRSDAALAKLRAARPLAKDPAALAAIGEELKALGAFSDCVPTFDQAIALKDAPELHTYRAVCKLGARDSAGAKADLQAAIDGQYAPAHFYLARVLSDSGDWAGAVAEYETFLKLEPNVPAAKVAREKLKVAREHLRK